MNKKRLLLLKVVVLTLFVFISGCTTFTASFAGDPLNTPSSFIYKELNIKYTDEGTGPTILFIHGLGASSFTWRHLYNNYKDEFRVINLDLKGFGESSKPIDKDYLVSDQSDIIHNFILEKDLKDVILIGNSYGGAIVLSSFLTGSPDIRTRIGKLILLDPAAYYQKKLPGYVTLLRTPIINRLVLSLGYKNFIAKIVLKQIFYNDDLITKDMIDVYGGYLKGLQSHNALIETAKNVTSMETKLLSAKYNEIDVPVLIVWGEFDNVIDISYGVRLNKDIPQSKFVVVDNCGHIPQEEFPNKTIEIIDDFLISSL